MTIAAIMNEEVAGTSARELTGDEELAIVTREVRKRRESAQAYTDGNRQELADKELQEAEVLSVYLPAPLTVAEIDAIIAEEIAAVEGATLKHMGLIIKAVNARAQGRADGSIIAGKVRAILSS